VADCRAQATAERGIEREREREREVCQSLDLILHVEVNGKEQVLSSQFVPYLCVSHANTHTRVQMWSPAPAHPCKCCSKMSVFHSFLPTKSKVFVILQSQPSESLFSVL